MKRINDCKIQLLSFLFLVFQAAPLVQVHVEMRPPDVDIKGSCNRGFAIHTALHTSLHFIIYAYIYGFNVSRRKCFGIGTLRIT